MFAFCLHQTMNKEWTVTYTDWRRTDINFERRFSYFLLKCFSFEKIDLPIKINVSKYIPRFSAWEKVYWLPSIFIDTSYPESLLKENHIGCQESSYMHQLFPLLLAYFFKKCCLFFFQSKGNQNISPWIRLHLSNYTSLNFHLSIKIYF